jgi:hypothetical protein
MPSRSEAEANDHLAERAARVRAQETLNREVLWRAAWLRASFNMGFRESVKQAIEERGSN